MRIKLKWMLGVLCRTVDEVICVVGHCLVAGVILAHMATITTILFRTEHRLFWAHYLLVLQYSGPACGLLAFLLYILTEFAVFSKQIVNKLKRRTKLYEAEVLVIVWLSFVSFFVSGFMLDWKWKYFTGDPWWHSAGGWYFLPSAGLGFCRKFQSLYYERIESFFRGNDA